MPDEHVPSPGQPWVRVRDAFGNELDRHYQSEEVLNGTFTVINGYPPNQTGQARETKIHVAKDAKPVKITGQALAEALDHAGLTEAAHGMTADEKRALLLEHETTHEPDPSQEG